MVSLQNLTALEKMCMDDPHNLKKSATNLGLSEKVYMLEVHMNSSWEWAEIRRHGVQYVYFLENCAVFEKFWMNDPYNLTNLALLQHATIQGLSEKVYMLGVYMNYGWD